MYSWVTPLVSKHCSWHASDDVTVQEVFGHSAIVLFCYCLVVSSAIVWLWVYIVLLITLTTHGGSGGILKGSQENWQAKFLYCPLKDLTSPIQIQGLNGRRDSSVTVRLLVSEKDKAIQVSAIICAMGNTAEEIFGSFGLPETDARRYDQVSKNFQNTSLNATTRFTNGQDSTKGPNNRVKVLLHSSHRFILSRSIASTALYGNKWTATGSL